ncbi:hypothetical protein [Nostoc sp.]|uniref:hypothetical protein n=1 Tax=Nostoc sp. TaxID=1180 RepID=UPI002FF5B3F4
MKPWISDGRLWRTIGFEPLLFKRRLGNHYYFWAGRDSPSRLSTTLDRRGINPHPDLCNAAKVPGVPTWIIKGRQYSGVQNHCVAAGDSFATFTPTNIIIY